MLRLLKVMLIMSAAVIGLLLIPAVRMRVLPSVANWLDVGTRPRCAEYVLALPGDEIYRPLTAAALIRVGLAREVLIPENPESADTRDGITPPTAQISRRVLLHRGIPDDRIVLLPVQSRTTFDDGQALLDFLRGREGEAMVVTSAFHTRRTSFLIRNVFGADAHRIRVVSAPNPGFSARDWWRKPEGMRLIATEYIKLAYYYLRYGGAEVWGAVGLILGSGMFLYFVRRRNIRGRTQTSR